MEGGVELVDAFKALAHEVGFTAAFVLSAIGKLARVDIGYSQDAGRYERVRFHESLTLVSCSGNIALSEGEIDAHLHVDLGDAEHRSRSGHLFEGLIEESVEFILIIIPGNRLYRAADSGHSFPVLHIKPTDE